MSRSLPYAICSFRPVQRTWWHSHSFSFPLFKTTSTLCNCTSLNYFSELLFYCLLNGKCSLWRTILILNFCPKVRLSVIHAVMQCLNKCTVHIVKPFTPSGRITISVFFLSQTALQNSKENLLCRALSIHGKKILRFQQASFPTRISFNAPVDNLNVRNLQRSLDYTLRHGPLATNNKTLLY